MTDAGSSATPRHGSGTIAVVPGLPAAGIGALADHALLAAVDSELASWTWLYLLIDAHPEMAERFDGYVQLRSAALGSRKPVDHIRTTADVLVAGNAIIRANSARGHFIRKYAAEQPAIAAAMLAFFLGTLTRCAAPQDYEAIVVATLYRKGLYQRAHSEALELSRVQDSWREIEARARSDSDAFQAAMRNATAVAHANLDRAQTDTAAVLARATGAIELAERTLSDALSRAETAIAAKLTDVESREAAAVRRTEERLEALRRTYVAQVALKAPVSFWREKRESHAAAALRHQKFLLLAAPIVVVVLALLAWEVLPPGEKLSIRSTGLFLALSSVAVWFLRVVVRLWLTHVHLELDARERIVMAETYLSLIEEGITSTDQERQIVMQALFTPAVRSSDRDDASASPLIEAASRLVGGAK